MVSDEKWQEIPVPTSPKQPDKYDSIIDVLQTDKAIQIEAQDEKSLKGLRIGIARRARQRGFVVDFRNVDLTLYAKRSTRPIPPPKSE